MPRTNKDDRASSQPPSQMGPGMADNTMTSRHVKAKRSGAKRKTPTAANKEALASSQPRPEVARGRQYLASRIEDWNEAVPPKSMVQHDFSEEKDPIVRAYLEAKLLLFQNAGLATAESVYGGSQSGKSDGSTRA